MDAGTQNETSVCLDAVSEGTYVLLAGARAVNMVNLAAAEARGDGLLGFVACGSHVP